jgi:nicotinamide mononucleotide transporter
MSNFSLDTISWLQLFGTTPVEIIATLSAVVGVVLIARQNILGWPLGILWAAISAWLAFTQWQLVSDGILYLAYIPIQLYCWFIWARGGGIQQEEPFIPAWLPRNKQLILIIAALLGIVGWAFSISTLAVQVNWIPEPALLWRETVLNLFAPFLQARKRMEFIFTGSKRLLYLLFNMPSFSYLVSTVGCSGIGLPNPETKRKFNGETWCGL